MGFRENHPNDLLVHGNWHIIRPSPRHDIIRMYHYHKGNGLHTTSDTWFEHQLQTERIYCRTCYALAPAEVAGAYKFLVWSIRDGD